MTTRNVNDLPPAEKEALEAVLGQPLAPDQQVFVMAYTPNAEPQEEVRDAARQNLQQTFAAVDEHAKASGTSPEEADAAIDEAMERIRPRTP